jgi:hypothetical protein
VRQKTVFFTSFVVCLLIKKGVILLAKPELIFYSTVYPDIHSSSLILKVDKKFSVPGKCYFVSRNKKQTDLSGETMVKLVHTMYKWNKNICRNNRDDSSVGSMRGGGHAQRDVVYHG